MMYAKAITAADMRSPLSLSSRAFVDHKYAYYKWLRENDPVHQGKLMGPVKATFLARYEDCMSALRDPRLLRNRTTATGGRRLPFPVPKSVDLLMTSMINEDAEDHRRLRNLVHKAFTPGRIGLLGGRIEALTAELLDAAEAKGEINLKEDFARPIPVTVIAEMVGVRVDELPELVQYMDAMTEGMGGLGFIKALTWELPKAVRFMRALIDRKRQKPGEDILTGLIEAEEEGERLSDDELVAMVFLLIIAGYETTYNLITNAVVTLLAHPEQLALVRAEPERMNDAIDEVLRYCGPIHGTKPIYPIEDVVFSGVTIPRGTTIMPMLGSANHDAAIFERPEVFDIAREKKKNLGFGYGIHFCLGAPLARLETSIALRALFERSPKLRITIPTEELVLESRPGWHSYKALPVALG